jgi:hypothetical protein
VKVEVLLEVLLEEAAVLEVELTSGAATCPPPYSLGEYAKTW